jgi:hypothetical protein
MRAVVKLVLLFWDGGSINSFWKVKLIFLNTTSKT